MIQLESRCEWCERPIPYTTGMRGRPRRYCNHLCSDAAYKQRKRTMPGRNETRCPQCYLVHAGGTDQCI